MARLISQGKSDFTNRSIMDMLSSNCIFTNVALTEDGDVWWPGLTRDPPTNLTDWRGAPCADVDESVHHNAR